MGRSYQIIRFVLCSALVALTSVASPARAQTPSLTNYFLSRTYAEVQDIATGPDGGLWFTEYNLGKIGRITTAGVLTEYAIPGSYPRPFKIVAGPDGALWFTDQWTISRIDTSGAIYQFPVPNNNYTRSIAAGSDGALWFVAGDATASRSDKIMRLRTSGVIYEYPTIGDGIERLAPGPDGSIWFVRTIDSNR